MTTHRTTHRQLAAAFLAASLLVACGGGDDAPEPEETAEPEAATPEPTEEPTTEPPADDLDAELDPPADADEPAGDPDTEVAPIEEWIAADQVGGDPIDANQVDVLHPPGTEVVQNQDALADDISVVTDLVVPNLVDAEGVFDGYLQQMLDSGWELRLIDEDGPTEQVQGDQVSWRVGVENPETTVSIPGGEIPEWELIVQVSHDDRGDTHVQLWHSKRVARE